MAKLTLRQENELLRDNLEKQSKIISDLEKIVTKSGFNKSYEIKINLESLVDDYVRIKNFMKVREGTIDAMTLSLKEENNRLYYIIRVLIGDKTVETDKNKPGNFYDQNTLLERSSL